MGEILKEPSKKPVKSRENRSGESSNTVSKQQDVLLSSANDNFWLGGKCKDSAFSMVSAMWRFAEKWMDVYMLLAGCLQR